MSEEKALELQRKSMNLLRVFFKTADVKLGDVNLSYPMAYDLIQIFNQALVAKESEDE